MSWEMRCRCNGCGTWKGDANGWLLAWADQISGARNSPVSFLGFALWDDEVARRDGVMHICSDTCKQGILSEHLRVPRLVEEPVDAAQNLAAKAQPVPAKAQPVPELTYEPVQTKVCAYCGPVCHGGAAHNARGEAGDRCSGVNE